MKVLLDNGQTLIKSQPRIRREGKHDAWHVHGHELIGHGLAANQENLAIDCVQWRLKSDEVFVYANCAPGDVAIAIALGKLWGDWPNPGDWSSVIGLAYNFRVRPLAIYKMTWDEFVFWQEN
jgi:hypothetical protein